MSSKDHSLTDRLARGWGTVGDAELVEVRWRVGRAILDGTIAQSDMVAHLHEMGFSSAKPIVSQAKRVARAFPSWDDLLSQFATARNDDSTRPPLTWNAVRNAAYGSTDSAATPHALAEEVARAFRKITDPAEQRIVIARLMKIAGLRPGDLR